MDSSRTSNRELFYMIIMFINGVLATANGTQGKKDIWISNLIAMIMGIVVVYMVTEILNRYPQKDMFGVIESIFGRKIGTVLNIAYVAFILVIATLLFRNISLFIKTVSMPESSLIVIIVLALVQLIWIVKKDMIYFSRFSKAIIGPFIFTVVISLVLLIPQIEIINILPVLENGIRPVLNGAFTAFIFPFGEVIVFFFIFGLDDKRDKKKMQKIFLWAMIIGGIILTLFNTFQVLVLGVERFQKHLYGSYAMFTRIQLGDFFRRVEIFMGLLFLFGDIVKITICIFAVLRGLKYIFKLDNEKILVIPLMALLLNCSILFIPNIIFIRYWVNGVWRYISATFEILLPLVFFILTKVKKHKIIKNI